MKSLTLSAAQDNEETIIEGDIESHDHESISDNNAVLKPAGIGTDKIMNNECHIENDTKTPTISTKDFGCVAIDQGAQSNFRTSSDFGHVTNDESDDECNEVSESDDDSDDDKIDTNISNISVYKEPTDSI